MKQDTQQMMLRPLVRLSSRDLMWQRITKMSSVPTLPTMASRVWQMKAQMMPVNPTDAKASAIMSRIMCLTSCARSIPVIVSCFIGC